MSNYALGERGGAEEVTLISSHIGVHGHDLTGAATATSSVPAANTALGKATQNIYAPSGGVTTLAPATVSPVIGNSLPHENRQPYQTINYIIALYGIFPTRP